MGQDLFVVTERWQRLVIEVDSVHTSLQHAIDNWKRYNASTETITVWISNAEQQINSTQQVAYIFLFNKCDFMCMMAYNNYQLLIPRIISQTWTLYARHTRF